jgi:hypothetical protein
MMMKTKTRLLAGVLMVMSGIALADGPPKGHPAAGMNIDKLEILLDLDAYQKQEVQKIFESQREAMRAKREQLRDSKARPSFEQMQAEREAAQKETRAKLEKLLTEQQLKKFDVLTERPPMRHPQRARGDNR